MAAGWLLGQGATIALIAALGLSSQPVHAADEARTNHRAVSMRVGETRTLVTLGGHRSDCSGSSPPQAIQIDETASLGTITRRENAPFTVGDSLSGTCIGMRFYGTAIDFTAQQPGTETVTARATFGNGRAVWVVTIAIRP